MRALPVAARARLSRGSVVASALLAGALVLASCGGSDGSDPALDQRALQHLSCADWRRASASERIEMIEGLRAFVGGEVTGAGASVRGSVLRDEDAHRLFENRCEQPFARAFSLYKLYGQAAGFAGVAP